MTKYTVCTEYFQFDPSKKGQKTPEEAYFTFEDHNDKIVAMCDTLEEARSILATIKVSSHRFNHSHAEATVAYIFEGEYEYEDGEWIFLGGGNIYDFKFEDIKG